MSTARTLALILAVLMIGSASAMLLRQCRTVADYSDPIEWPCENVEENAQDDCYGLRAVQVEIHTSKGENYRGGALSASLALF